MSSITIIAPTKCGTASFPAAKSMVRFWMASSFRPPVSRTGAMLSYFPVFFFPTPSRDGTASLFGAGDRVPTSPDQRVALRIYGRREIRVLLLRFMNVLFRQYFIPVKKSVLSFYCLRFIAIFNGFQSKIRVPVTCIAELFSFFCAQWIVKKYTNDDFYCLIPIPFAL